MAQAFSVPVLKKTLEQIGLDFTVQVSDVALLLAKDREANQKARVASGKAMDWTSYHRYDEVGTGSKIVHWYIHKQSITYIRVKKVGSQVTN